MKNTFQTRKPHLLIVRGTPGSGKSTFSNKLAQQFNVAHFENDMFLIHNGTYSWTPEAAKAAAKKCFDSVMNALKEGKDCIVSNVFVTRKAVDKYLKVAEQLGAKVMVVRMNHDFGNIHNVPFNTLKSMKVHFEDYPGEQIK